MKINFTIGAIVFITLFASCKKEKSGSGTVVPLVETIKIDLAQKEVKYGSAPVLLDFDKDGTRDFIFNITLVGDPVLGVDKRKFMAGSGVNALFAVNDNQEAPCMNRNDIIPLENFDGYHWNLVLSVMLVERWEDGAGNITWHGNWKAAVKKYLPFQLNINNKKHNGWLELSIDITNQKVVLHKAAYTRYPEKEIRAGE